MPQREFQKELPSSHPSKTPAGKYFPENRASGRRDRPPGSLSGFPESEPKQTESYPTCVCSPDGAKQVSRRCFQDPTCTPLAPHFPHRKKLPKKVKLTETKSASFHILDYHKLLDCRTTPFPPFFSFQPVFCWHRLAILVSLLEIIGPETWFFPLGITLFYLATSLQSAVNLEDL